MEIYMMVNKVNFLTLIHTNVIKLHLQLEYRKIVMRLSIY